MTWASDMTRQGHPTQRVLVGTPAWAGGEMSSVVGEAWTFPD